MGNTSNQYGVLTICIVFKYSNVSPVSIYWEVLSIFLGNNHNFLIKKWNFKETLKIKYSIIAVLIRHKTMIILNSQVYFITLSLMGFSP